MKTMKFPLGILFVMFILSCSIYAGPQSEDLRRLDPFDGIGVGVHADVYYTQGNSNEIRIEGEERDVRDLITEVRDGVLQIRYDNQRIRRSKLTIYVTSEELESVKISGSARFEVGEPLVADEMELAVSGSGSIIFNRLTSDEVDIKISGSGSIDLEDGTADELGISISGSGSLDAEQFDVSECSASISGSGEVRIMVRDELDVRLSGSGRLYYNGNPEVNSVSSGSGKVVAL